MTEDQFAIIFMLRTVFFMNSVIINGSDWLENLDRANLPGGPHTKMVLGQEIL